MIVEVFSSGDFAWTNRQADTDAIVTMWLRDRPGTIVGDPYVPQNYAILMRHAQDEWECTANPITIARLSP